MIPNTTDASRPEAATNLLRFVPGGMRAGQEEMTVAALVVGSFATLFFIRKGLKGIGPIQLAGSAISGVEFAAYLVIVGAAFRTLQTQFPNSGIARGLNYVY